MNIAFLTDEPLDSVVINTADGRPLYEIHTPWKFTSRTTTVRRGAPGQAEIVAEVKWHKLTSSTITFLGSTIPVNEFLKKDGIWSRSFTANDGIPYKWKYDAGELTLINCHTKTEVAQAHQSELRLTGGFKKMNIDVHPQGFPALDAIVVSFIIMEERARERRRQTTNATVIAATTST